MTGDEVVRTGGSDQGLRTRAGRSTGSTVTVGPGVTGLVGANGAGKSTLIKILLGPARRRPPARRGCSASTSRPRARRSGGRSATCPSTTACRPTSAPPSSSSTWPGCRGCRATAARERAADMLRHVGLYEERYRPIGGYSTGMKQRVKLAQALVHDPALVLLDEPTNGLDPAGRDEMLAPDPADRQRLRHLGAGHLAPARRARAGQRPRGRHRRRPAAAGRRRPPTSSARTGTLLVEVLGEADAQGCWAGPGRRRRGRAAARGADRGRRRPASSDDASTT